ncbi:peptidase [Cellvibrio zantedeschiae]|uniref:Peptidase n=1 Tax=Cellvibrio zantedeschiae TaxID=1237077 RepID=A0ABQ3AW56_9GAMM|nr:S9 family peptidase [Cellvibrio zantedeschiae]GGY69253.1 peptidase [Cellvibrio zantedeschiae]
MTNTYGNWPSPITAEMLTQQSAKISEPQACGLDVFWLESRPAEKGRNALVQLFTNGARQDVLAAPHSVRSRAHEYGGSSYLVTPERIFCVLDADQGIYVIDRATHTLEALSAPDNYRYADFCWDQRRQRLICIREDHTHANHAAQIYERSEIVAIDLKGNVQVLVSGADFYSNPRLNSTSDKLSYLCWNHPQMPWDGSECYCASINAAGDITTTQFIAGSKTESVFQPQWSPNDELFFVSDRNNWWNIYRHTFNSADGNRAQSPSTDKLDIVDCICDMPAEFATPQWIFGMSTYGFLNHTEIFCCFSQKGQWNLGLINIPNKSLTTIPNDFKDIAGVHCYNSQAYFLAAGAVQSTVLYRFYKHQIKAVLPANPGLLSSDDIAQPEAISFATTDGEIAHGFYYAPKNKSAIIPQNLRPPLIVMCHGGPTGATETSLNIKIQFWTSRGFAVLDVNYRGSTGYGREYRDRLKNNWGVTDVIDVCSGARYLIERGLVDKNKVAIRGSSAGGYTVLAALTFSDTFKAGASLYGIGDLEALAKDTHKFEARYLDSLVGEYPARQDLYRARSPIHHIEQLNCPVIFLQGLKDKVVPPNQAEAMVAALRSKGIKTAYVTFAEEGHGFRQAETIQKAIEAELEFYLEVFNHKQA